MIEKKLKKIKVTIVDNILYALKENRYPAFFSKHNSNGDKHVILLMSSNREKWHNLQVNKTISIIERVT